MILQTSNARLRERALQDNVGYETLINLEVSKEQSALGAEKLEKASGASNQSGSRIKVEQEVRRLRQENKQLKAQSQGKQDCTRCGNSSCNRKKCPANGNKCSKCHKLNHFAKVCRTKQKSSNFGQVESASESDSEESSGRVVVGKLNSSSIVAKLEAKGQLENAPKGEVPLATDTGISKTVFNRIDWAKIKDGCKFVKTSKRFRPYGTHYHLPIKGKALVTLTAENGAQIDTWVYVNNDPKEQSLLGERDARRLGIVKLNLKGENEAVILDEDEDVRNIEYKSKKLPCPDNVSGGQSQTQIDANMEILKKRHSKVFSDRTGKCHCKPIEIQVKSDAVPVIQPSRRIPLHYVAKLKEELDSMLKDDIIEGPIAIEEPGTFLSNLVITKKRDSSKIRVTLDCKDVNKEIYATHEPIPTSEELRHQLAGSDRFSTLDMTNCYHQFEIAESARKLFSFRTPWGIFRYKRMVMGTSPASSEIQKKIRQMVSKCKNAIHIKDDILVHGHGKAHDNYLEDVLKVLGNNGVTLRLAKCHLGQAKVKWFGNIYSKEGMSPDLDK